VNTLTPPDIEAVLVDICSADLEVDFYAQVPRSRQGDSEPFGVIRRLGGVRGRAVTDEPMVSVETWAPNRTDAYHLCAAACTTIFALVGTVREGVTFYKVAETSGPTSLPDPDSEMPRYTATLLVRVRGLEQLPESS
jgi:hypothetical protein